MVDRWRVCPSKNLGYLYLLQGKLKFLFLLTDVRYAKFKYFKGLNTKLRAYIFILKHAKFSC